MIEFLYYLFVRVFFKVSPEVSSLIKNIETYGDKWRVLLPDRNCEPHTTVLVYAAFRKDPNVYIQLKHKPFIGFVKNDIRVGINPLEEYLLERALSGLYQEALQEIKKDKDCGSIIVKDTISLLNRENKKNGSNT